MLARESEKGVFLVFFAVYITILLAIVGFAVDLYRQSIVHSELQNAADSCSLAAAGELNGFTDYGLRAKQVGTFVAIQNDINFNNSPAVNVNVIAPSSSILVDPSMYVPAHVVCKVTVNNFLYYFLRLPPLRLRSPRTIEASSEATLMPAQAAMAAPIAVLGRSLSGTVLPLSLNRTASAWKNASIVNGSDILNVPSSSPVNTFIAKGDLVEGIGLPAGTVILKTKFDEPTNLTGKGFKGTYRLSAKATITKTTDVTFTSPAFLVAPNSNVNNPINALQYFGYYYQNTSIASPMRIFIGSDASTTDSIYVSFTSSNLRAFEDALNTRFGLFNNQATANLNFTDLTGVGFNTYKLAGPGSYEENAESLIRTPYQSPINNYSSLTVGSSSSQSVNGASNRRLIVVPVLNLGFVSDWACVLLLNPESSFQSGKTSLPILDPVDAYLGPIASLGYIGAASALDSPCRTFGLPGGKVGPLVPTLIK